MWVGTALTSNIAFMTVKYIISLLYGVGHSKHIACFALPGIMADGTMPMCGLTEKLELVRGIEISFA